MKFSKRISTNLLEAYRGYQLLFLLAYLPVGGGSIYFINRSLKQYTDLRAKLYVFHRDGASIQVVGQPVATLPPGIRAATGKSAPLLDDAPRHPVNPLSAEQALSSKNK